jgi:hypothetical protein
MSHAIFSEIKEDPMYESKNRTAAKTCNLLTYLAMQPVSVENPGAAGRRQQSGVSSSRRMGIGAKKSQRQEVASSFVRAREAWGARSLWLVFCVLRLACAPTAQAQSVYFGGPLGGGLSNPWGVAVDGSGNAYVADYGNGFHLQLASCNTFTFSFDVNSN